MNHWRQILQGWEGLKWNRLAITQVTRFWGPLLNEGVFKVVFVSVFILHKSQKLLFSQFRVTFWTALWGELKRKKCERFYLRSRNQRFYLSSCIIRFYLRSCILFYLRSCILFYLCSCILFPTWLRPLATMGQSGLSGGGIDILVFLVSNNIWGEFCWNTFQFRREQWSCYCLFYMFFDK